MVIYALNRKSIVKLPDKYVVAGLPQLIGKNATMNPFVML